MPKLGGSACLHQTIIMDAGPVEKSENEEYCQDAAQKTSHLCRQDVEKMFRDSFIGQFIRSVQLPVWPPVDVYEFIAFL